MNDLPLFSASWISIVAYIMLVLIVGMGTWQFFSKQFVKKARFLSWSLVPLGLASLSFSLIGMIKSYVVAFHAADAVGEMSKVQLSHAIVHGFLNGAPYPILGLLCLGISFVFKYINQ